MSTSEQMNNTFWSTMDREVGTIHATKSVGENGADEHSMYGLAGETASQLQGALVAIFAGTVRGATKERVMEFIKNVEQTAVGRGGNTLQNAMATLIVLAFQLRDCRGGKGEKQLSRWMLMEMFLRYPRSVNALVPLFPEYGYWKDLSFFIEDCHKDPRYTSLVDTCYETMVSQLKDDLETLNVHESKKDAGKLTLSLLAKYIPKEGRSFDKKYRCSKRLALLLFPEEFRSDCFVALRKYRQLVSRINKTINTTEVLMSEKRYDEINFNLVPGRCLNLNRRAFLNLKGGKKCKTEEIRSYDENRIQCSENLKNHLELAAEGKAKVNGKQMFIHELARNYINTSYGWGGDGSSNLSESEQKIFQLQWNAIREDLRKKVETEGLDINRGVPLIDVSGSMSGPPMEVAVSMGILISELQDSAYGNRFISFHENPKWIEFQEEWSLKQKVEHAVKSSWGGSTDFLAAHDLILSIAVKEKLKPNQLPSWFLVVSDMQFNDANRGIGCNEYPILKQYADRIQLSSLRGSVDQYGRPSYSTKSSDFQPIHDILVESYKRVGMAVCGEPYVLPRTVYWNVRGDTVGFPVQADTPNTQMISGWSSDLLPLVLENKIDAYAEQPDKTMPTSWDLFVKAMSQERYDPVLQVIEKTQEGIFNGFRAPVREKEEEEEENEEKEEEEKEENTGWSKMIWNTDKVMEWVKQTIGPAPEILTRFLDEGVDGSMFNLIANSEDHQCLEDIGVENRLKRVKLFSEWSKVN